MKSKYFINDLEFTKNDFYIYLYNYITEYNLYNKSNININYNNIKKDFTKKRYYYYKLNDKEFKKIIEK